jgi:hypothetical protein
LEVYGEERVPATGIGLDDLVIPQGDDGSIMLHANEIRSGQQARRALALTASYIALHPILSEREFAVGVTHKPLADLAVRAAGFFPLRPYGPDQAYYKRLSDVYDTMRIASRRPLQLAMIYMRTDELVDTYAVKRLGRNAQDLLDQLCVEDVEG